MKPDYLNKISKRVQTSRKVVVAKTGDGVEKETPHWGIVVDANADSFVFFVSTDSTDPWVKKDKSLDRADNKVTISTSDNDIHSGHIYLNDLMCYLSLLEGGRPEDKLECKYKHLLDYSRGIFVDYVVLYHILKGVFEFIEDATIKMDINDTLLSTSFWIVKKLRKRDAGYLFCQRNLATKWRLPQIFGCKREVAT